MRRIIASLLLGLSFCYAQAQGVHVTIDSTSIAEQNIKIESLQRQVTSLTNTVNRLQREVNLQTKNQASVSETVSSLSGQIDETNASVQTTAEVLQEGIKATQENVDNLGENVDGKISRRSLVGIVFGVALLALLALAYTILRKRIALTSDSIGAVRDAQAKLQEESLRLDEKIVSLFEKQLATMPVQQTEDHSLILKISNELARMETNLSRMDATVKGHKQLMSAVKRIKENLLANGYEFVDMLGKPYHEGMIVDADFVSNEELEEGQQIISGVTKPQINYNGKMIQSAKITVSQNI